MSKNERRQKRKELLDEVAARYGMKVDELSELKDFMMFYMNIIGLKPEINPQNNGISSLYVDDNGYITVRLNCVQKRANLTNAAVRLVRMHEAGQITKAGDLSHILITPSAKSILDEEMGKDWKAIISQRIADHYAKHGCTSKGYLTLTETVGFKITAGKLMVEANFKNVRYKNEYVIAPGISATNSLLLYVEGKRLSEIVEGIPYEGLKDTRIKRGEVSPGAGGKDTLVLRLDENLETIS